MGTDWDWDWEQPVVLSVSTSQSAYTLAVVGLAVPTVGIAIHLTLLQMMDYFTVFTLLSSSFSITLAWLDLS